MPTLNERIADVVKRKRQRDKLTQAELGTKIGVSGSYIGSIESAQTSPRISELEGLAAAFRTTALDLIGEAGERDNYKFTAANRERDAFMSLYDSLTPEHRETARKFLMFLREQQEQGE